MNLLPYGISSIHQLAYPVCPVIVHHLTLTFDHVLKLLMLSYNVINVVTPEINELVSRQPLAAGIQ
jgi:hypothetical protein